MRHFFKHLGPKNNENFISSFRRMLLSLELLHSLDVSDGTKDSSVVLASGCFCFCVSERWGSHSSPKNNP